ncbi:ral GTPase-activating protein subunit beta-like isoform X4 [Bolinopsis microptera]|uniref:ral GTPase-activating protein subunit beta-like isoform X4 n=1 Tax=Bolinopsis microptera TaxID=2820187 RepID=UPI0030791976
MTKPIILESCFDKHEKQRTYDRLVSRAEKIRGVSKEVKIKTLENYWPYPPHSEKTHIDKPDETVKALLTCNNSFWHSKVRSVQELEIAMNYIHDGLMLDDCIDTLERCVSIYTHWLTKLKASNFRYNDKASLSTSYHGLPEWFFEHTESIFKAMLGDLGLLFNIYPHTAHAETRHGDRIIILFKSIFDTIALVGDIPKDAGDALKSGESIGDDINSNLCRKSFPWLWSNILKMLLYIVDRWFYTDVHPNSVPKVAEQAIKLLINAFIVASHESFPEVELWQEFELLCKGIIHIETVCREWKAICETLTVHHLKRMYGSQHCGSEARNTYMMHEHMKLPSIISMMEYENLLQCWARFIVLLGNPAELMNTNSPVRWYRVESSCNSAGKYKNKNVIEKREFLVEQARPAYPAVCLKMIQGISCMVNTMLKVGLPHNTEYDGDRPESPDKLAASQALMFNKRPIYEQYASPAHSAPSKLNTRQHRDVPLDSKLIPTGNSVLRLFGEWLFDCTAIIGTIDHNHQFYGASAEALGTLCYIFSHNRNNDPFEETYMIRFVIRLMQGLKCGKRQLERDKHVKDKTNDILVKILQQSGSLFKVDLPGINALVSSYISMIELVLGNHVNDFSAKELRRDAIEILLSIICLPLRYPTITLEDLEGDSKLYSASAQLKTMGELWSKCVEIMIVALENSIQEDDLVNKSQIMKGLYILLLDKRHHYPEEEYSNQTSPVTKYSREADDVECTLENKANSNHSIVEDLNDNLQRVWMKMIELICEILDKTSEQDIKFWYVPFGILCGLANTFPYNMRIQSGYQLIISNLCKYIECLTNKPSTLHREELHTMLAAAYNCLTVWCLNYTELFTDGPSLLKCLQVIESGISSRCSYNHVSHEKVLKEDKKKLPISKRVGDKAQFLLKQLHNHNPLRDQLNQQHHLSERQLLEHWSKLYPGHEARLQYLVIESDTILCLINPPPGLAAELGTDTSNKTPVLYIVLRDPDVSLSVHWLKYEKDPLTDKSSPRQKVCRPKVPENTSRNQPEVRECTIGWPDILHRNYVHLKEDTSTFEDVQERLKETACPQKGEFCDTREFVREEQLTQEIKRESERTRDLSDPPPPPDLQIPQCVSNIDSARLFLAHSGILTPKMFDDSDQSPSVVLLKNSPALQARLKELDDIPTRDCHTVVVLLMRTGQNSVKEILRNTNLLSANKAYHDFVVELGDKLVDVSKFEGWTGLQPFENWSNKNIDTPAPTFPYYSDSFNEMIFLLPNLIPTQGDLDSPCSPDLEPQPLFEQEFSEASVPLSGARSYYQRDLLENILWEVPVDSGKEKSVLSKIVVVWAESFDDTRRFLINNLALGLDCDKDSRCVVIFIHPLQSGLFKTSVRSLNKNDKFNTVGLVDEKEKVVSKEILGIVIRETCLAIRTSSLLEQSPRLRPRSRRLNHITDRIIHEHRSNDTENGYYNAFCKEH